MKIAIVTWFHYRNFGTALQVSALYSILKSNGHDVDVVRYYPRRKGRTLPDYSFQRIGRSAGKKVRSFIKRFSSQPRPPVYRYFCDAERESLFERYHSERMTFTSECKTLSDLESLNSQYDAFICGSDQIWSPSLFDPHYCLDFVTDPNKLIAYAPSIGLSKISDQYVCSQMKALISRFKHLSVREEQGAELIRSMIGRNPPVVADPSLLLTRNEWELDCKSCLSEHSPPYLLAYFLGHEECHWDEVYRIAKKRGIRVQVIPVFENDLHRDGCIKSGIGPEQFVSLIKNADYVCTDSFHGTLFSMQFQKQFTVFERFKKNDPINQNSRIYNILLKTGTQDRLVPFHGKYVDKPDIDYSSVNQILAAFRQQSKEYLLGSLGIVSSENVPFSENHILSDHSLCCGCGACAVSCPKDAITISLNGNGFFHATVDNEKCIQCGKCKTICPFETKKRGTRMESAAVYSYKDGASQVLSSSSSGGAAYRLAYKLLEKGYAVAGCTFDIERQIARHILIERIDDLYKIQGSKYLQSLFSELLFQIGEYEKPIAFFGTPCQIAAARNLFSKKDGYIYVDLICHGVPSYHLLEQYKAYLNKKYHMASDTINICFRYKPKGWREKHSYITDGHIEACFSQKDDPFLQFFETINCYSDACYECRWRDSSAADIRLGDFWGPVFEGDREGVSVIACLTERGKVLLSDLKLAGAGSLTAQSKDSCFRYQQLENETMPLFHDELIEKLGDKDNELTMLQGKYSDPFSRDKKPKNKTEKYFQVMKRVFIEELRR